MHSSHKQSQARAVGRLYLLLALTGIFTLVYVPAHIFVPDDPGATIARVTSSELLFRTGILVGLVSTVLYVFVALALYRLLSEISQKLAILMVALALVGASASFANTFNQIAVLILLSGADFLSAFDRPQTDGLAYLFLYLNRQALQVIQIFWGLWLFPFGWLVYRSEFIPKVFGILLFVAGFGYLLSTFIFLILPQYKSTLAPLVVLLEAAEFPIIVWLLIVGTKSQADTGHAS